ncbi:MAG: hypothetical protein J6W69_08205 [Bacteroidales bacterium]|nr:hypothetical protein [Bacteroidales bacterium]
MKKISTLLFIFMMCAVGVQGASVPAGPQALAIKAQQKEQKAMRDSLKRDLRDARLNTNDKSNPNFAAARASLEHAFKNPYGKDNADVVLQAANTEFQCFKTERNKPASGGKMDEKVIYASTAAGFRYYCEAYRLYRHPAAGKSVVSPGAKGYLQMQSNAYELYRCTQGFRATAGYYAKQKDWASAHEYYTMALQAMDCEILADYARTQPEVKADFDVFRSDSIRQRLFYSCAVTAVQMQDHALAVKELERAKYCGIEPNRIRQQLCKEYLILKDTIGYERALRDGANLLPNEPWYAENLLNLSLARNDHKQALAIIDRVIDSNPDNARTYELKGQLQDEAGDLDGAITSFMQAITIDTTLIVSYSSMGRIYFNRALETEEALVEARQFDAIYTTVVPMYEAALPYYNKAFDNDTERRDSSIAAAIRTILYKRFQSPNCRNARQLIRRYNEVSKAYGMSTL